MGYSAYRAYTTGLSPLSSIATQRLTKQGCTLYSIQLFLNLIWTPLFFGLKKPVAATVDIALLGGTVSYLTYVWSQVDAVSGWCLAP